MSYYLSYKYYAQTNATESRDSNDGFQKLYRHNLNIFFFNIAMIKSLRNDKALEWEIILERWW